MAGGGVAAVIGDYRPEPVEADDLLARLEDPTETAHWLVAPAAARIRSDAEKIVGLEKALAGLLAVVDQMDRPVFTGGGVLPVDKAQATFRARVALKGEPQ